MKFIFGIMKSLLWLFYRKQTSFLFVLISAGHSHTISGNVPILPAGSKKSVSTPSGSVKRCVIRTSPSGSVQKQISLLPKLIPKPDLPAHGRYSISSRNLKTWAFVLPWACLAARMGPVHVQDYKVFKPPQQLCHNNFCYHAHFLYDQNESAKIAVFFTLELCHQNMIPVL